MGLLGDDLQTILARIEETGIGHEPATSLIRGQVDTDSDGYIITVPDTTPTNIKGVFAAGDVQEKRYRQGKTGPATNYEVRLVRDTCGIKQVTVRTSRRSKVGHHACLCAGGHAGMARSIEAGRKREDRLSGPRS